MPSHCGGAIKPDGTNIIFIMEQIYTPNQNYKVLVHTITYNQAKYITDTLDGVAMQQTNFPFVHYVIDDCSTDGEQDVIKSWLTEHCDMEKAEYVELELSCVIIVPHKVNKNLTCAIYLLRRNLWKEPSLKRVLIKPWREICEYESWCEGDDFWIDPEKLQKQQEYLAHHPGCSYLFTDRYIDYEEKKIRMEIRYKKNIYNTDDILSGFIPGLQTIMCYTKLFEHQLIQTKKINGDRLFAYIASTIGEIHCLHDVTAVYRNSGDGISTGIIAKELFNHTVRDFFYFHKGLNSPNRHCYLLGQSQYLREFGVGYNKLYRLIYVYGAYKKIDESITFGEFVKMLYYSFIRKMKIHYNLWDPYVMSSKITK